MSTAGNKCYITVVRGVKRLLCYLHLCCLKVICGSIMGFCVQQHLTQCSPGVSSRLLCAKVGSQRVKVSLQNNEFEH
jgi:hypothetical protein